MWFFNCPEIVHGEDALGYLEELPGHKAFIVTDPVLHQMGFTARIQKHLQKAKIESLIFAEVETEPSLQTVDRGAEAMRAYQPDWIIGLGGGSALDAAKSMWALYERPDLEAEMISPIYRLNLSKTKMIAIPTTSGTGSEATWMVVLTDLAQHRKLGLGNRELTPTIAIVDPILTQNLPPQITADTGIDVLTHAIEGYTNNWHNDFCDGLCLKAIQLVFDYLPRAVAQGATDSEARERMANAATIAGLGFGNSYAGLAHAMGHSFGAYFKVPHGRTVGLFLPYTMEFILNQGGTRYGEIAHFMGFGRDADAISAEQHLIKRIRELQQVIGQPTSIQAMGISAEDFQRALVTIVPNAEIDNSILAAPRMPETEEMQQLFEYAYTGKSVDF
ncbi:MAG: iron-containing alcohol dehydrogenase [Chloroflexi bacterium]|nr:iron-containing alcohol dehydrogenase [Chloroflexota bacterium]